MRKIYLTGLLLPVIFACSKQDPILPGVRTPIFNDNEIKALNIPVPNLPEKLNADGNADCQYIQDDSNVIWNGDKKIFSGFPADNYVNVKRHPVCNKNFVYSALTTGEVVKINPSSRKIEWIADVFRDSNMTGGSSIVDIPAPIIIQNGKGGAEIYAAGLGDSFCKISDKDGSKKWCVYIGVGVPFIVTESAAFIVGTDNNMYAINTETGDIYWKTAVEKQAEPKYDNHIITVGDQEFDAFSGKEND